MIKLILMSNNNLVGEYPFLQESMIIGRQRDNAIVIDNLAVSRRHAKIDKVGSDYIITDLQSTNGTWVNGRQIVSQTLSEGDTIVIGKHVLLFTGSEETAVEPGVEHLETDLKRTMVLDMFHAVHHEEKIGVLQSIGGLQLGEIKLRKSITRIGKADTSDIRVPALLMGATAATIGRRPTGYTISFGEGMRRLKVNGEVIKGTMPLKDMDTIQLGPYKFQFYEKTVQQPQAS